MMSEQMVIGGGGQAGARAAQQRAHKAGAAGRHCEQKGASSLWAATAFERCAAERTQLAGCLIRPPEFYTQHAITLHLATEAVMIDRPAQRLLLTGEALPYHRLLLAGSQTTQALSSGSRDHEYRLSAYDG